ncbi:DUF305 domain-containing protein [uncultured Sphingomonas sp.]|uniref:DUF305 domain-containing protein n=1 Tax=uncultured Sphingomonas sp. TaxID=158754 RepID=UPI00261F5011|nr:DUF305 domain-containing protein [uncultured Sphingomonas sp.]
MDPQDHQSGQSGGMGMSYGRFAAMIATSTIVMFGLMYLNTYALSHVEYSQTRTWMAIVMGAVMALIMIGFMWGMYPDRRANLGIVAGAIVVFAGALWLVRSQETVGDVAYMKAMIPHHSIAIMTSERAHIKDPEVRKLADGIIDAQVREIAQMKRAIARLEAHPTADDAPDLPSNRDKQVAPPPPETDESVGVNTLQPIR